MTAVQQSRWRDCIRLASHFDSLTHLITYPSGSCIRSAIEIIRRPRAWITVATGAHPNGILVPVATTETKVDLVRVVIVGTDPEFGGIANAYLVGHTSIAKVDQLPTWGTMRSLISASLQRCAFGSFAVLRDAEVELIVAQMARSSV
jgi:hypothetical protein